MDKIIIKEWDDIVRTNITPIYGLNEVQSNMLIATELDISITSIFDVLRKVKNNRFYTSKEIETVYLLVKENVNSINEILIMMDNTITKEIYEIILNIFDELVLLAEDYSLYEICGNLTNIRDYWFKLFNIRIQNSQAKGAK